MNEFSDAVPRLGDFGAADIGGILTAAALLVWPRAVWHLVLNAARTTGFNVDAPVIRVSWEDVGSGVLALFATAVVLGWPRNAGNPRAESSVLRLSRDWLL